MTAREICYSYRSARHKAQQIQMLDKLDLQIREKEREYKAIAAALKGEL